jgi:hypothetical protein
LIGDRRHSPSGYVESIAGREATTVPTRRRKKKIDPFDQHVWHHLAVLEWHASYSGPTWEKRKEPYTDWRDNKEKIRIEYDLDHEDYLSLEMWVLAYKAPVLVRKREFRKFEFCIYSCTDVGGGLFQICPDGELRGWARYPVAGVQALLTVLSAGRAVKLVVHASEFWRGQARIHTNGGWCTARHPSLEDGDDEDAVEESS